MSLIGKQIVLGVTGSIAAYKSADLVRRLKEAGAEVRVVMTEHAKRFITPLTMQAVSGHPVRDDLFDLQAEAAMGHIELARWADLVLVAPASAGFMSRLVEGRADDLLSTLCLATEAPIAIAPAMNQQMWQDERTQDNRQSLLGQGVIFFGPAEGSQACGETGPGRMEEPGDLVSAVETFFSGGALQGLHVVLTAGPTQEAIDPVRYLTNGSSGKMGYALAAAARDAGAKVSLISGPVSLLPPKGVDFQSVTSGQQMHDAVLNVIESADVFIGVAAVADYKPKTIASEKTPKSDSALTLELEPNIDIIKHVARATQRPFVVGFAAETHELITKARAKRQSKKMDIIIANSVAENKAMHADDNEVYFISEETETHLPLANKASLAKQLIHLISEEYRKYHDRKSHAA